jgi:hypothetical protein
MEITVYINIFCGLGKEFEINPEPVFLNLLRSPETDSQSGGRYKTLFDVPGSSGYIGWRNRFLGIDSWAP